MSQMRPMIRDLGKYTQQLAEQTNQQISQMNQQVLVIGTATFDGGTVRQVRFETKPHNDAGAQAADPEAKKGAEQARARFVGLPVGGEVKSDDAKVTFKVVEVYDIDRAKAEEVRTKAAAEAAAAQKAAAEAAPPPATGGMKPVKKAPGGKKNANAAK